MSCRGCASESCSSSNSPRSFPPTRCLQRAPCQRVRIRPAARFDLATHAHASARLVTSRSRPRPATPARSGPSTPARAGRSGSAGSAAPSAPRTGTAAERRSPRSPSSTDSAPQQMPVLAPVPLLNPTADHSIRSPTWWSTTSPRIHAPPSTMAAQIHKNNLNPTKSSFSPDQTFPTAYFKLLSIENLPDSPDSQAIACVLTILVHCNNALPPNSITSPRTITSFAIVTTKSTLSSTPW